MVKVRTGPGLLLLHQSDDERRVDASRQECAERHIRDQTFADGPFQQLLEVRLRLLFGSLWMSAANATGSQ